MSDLLENRKQKHIENNGGSYPLCSFQEKNYSISKILDFAKSFARDSLDPAQLDSTLYHVKGRIKAIRKSGGIAFVKIQDYTASIQLILTKNVLGEEKFKALNLFDLGDIVEASGQVCLTKAGEKSLLLNKPLVLLSKALLPLPEKWTGLVDKETIYKQRYLDLISNHESFARFKARSAIIKAVRGYLDELNFMEVETPMLQSLNSGANAKPFITHHNAADKDLFLRIAPELNLKRLLVGGIDRVYEIGKSFRNEGVSSRHNPEFTMLEFYQAYGNFEDLLSYCKDLILKCKDATSNYLWDCKVDFTHFKIISMLEAVRNSLKREFNFDCHPEMLINDSYNHWPSDWSKDSQKSNLLLPAEEILKSDKSFGEKLFELFELLAEPYLAQDYQNSECKSIPVIITDYPAEVCPLARKKDSDKRFCDRFELYLNGIEVANGYQELNNPEEQQKRFEEQLISNKKDPMDLDRDYVQALSYGMPPAIGFGMGIDRVAMILTGAESIRDVILFPSVKL